MILEIELITGRFHATPWGRHVNEAVPEWPPSPFRLLRALVDAWHRKARDLPAAVVERLLGALAAPPSFALPSARASHTRSFLSQNKEDPTDKKLVFDGFTVVDRGAVVLVGWPGVQLDIEALDAFRKLVDAMSYLGRSESWVTARVVDDREVRWNCTPLVPGPIPEGKEVVTIAGVVPPREFECRAFEVPARGKQKPRRLGWLEALTWGSAETIEHTLNRPPALEPLFYLRARDAVDARPPSVPRRGAGPVEVVHFALEGKVRVPITESIRVAEAFRRNVMGSLKRVVKDAQLPSTLTGKEADGRPLRGHPHASFLPIDEVGNGEITGLWLVSPTPLTLEELRALDHVRPFRLKSEHPLVPTPTRFGAREDLLPAVTEVVSLTPFAPTNHRRAKRDGDEATWLTRQVELECERRGLPKPVSVIPLPPRQVRERTLRWLEFRRARKEDAPRSAYGLRIVFSPDTPVRAPFSLGYASHFGLGCFVPSR